MALKIFILPVIHKLLFSKLYIADTPTSRWNVLNKHFQELPANGASVTATVSRNGDLVGKMYVTSSTANITAGDSIVEQVDVEIGGQRIDRHYREWLQIWAELSTPDSKALGYKNMTGALSHGLSPVGMVQIPLQFWFNRNPGLALPLIALQYHEVKIKIVLGTATGTAGVKLWADYIYLDTDERRRFAQVSHEYLIEQLQRETASVSTSQKLNFNHPVKELVWTSGAVNTYGTADFNLMVTTVLQLKKKNTSSFVNQLTTTLLFQELMFQ